MSKVEAAAGLGSCGCFLTILAVNLTLGAMAFNYSVETIFGKHLPIFVDVLGGLFLGELTIPCAVVCWVAAACGVHIPFVHAGS
jgi:EamA domain-containing membrane protein RarD